MNNYFTSNETNSPQGSTCCICGCTFTARHSYGLCPICFNKDDAREMDRVTTSSYKARKIGLAANLTLVEWLSVLSDFLNLCAFCKQYPCSVIEMVEPDKGLVYDNVVPSCKACHARRAEGYDAAEERVRWYLSTEHAQRLILPHEEDTTP